MIDIEIMAVKDKDGKSTLQYSGVWLENKENIETRARWNLTQEQWEKEFEEFRGQGWRPVDLEQYVYNGTMYYAVIWVKNKDNRGWYLVWGQPDDDFKTKFKEMAEKNYKPVDIDSYLTNGTSGEMRYLGIWESDPTNEMWRARWNLTYKEYNDYADEFQEENLMPADFYSYSKDGDTYYGGFWVNNKK